MEWKKDALSLEQVKNLIDSSQGNDIISKRNYALINLLVRTGIRAIEAARADIGDIRNIDETSVLYVHGKGRQSKDNFVVLTESCLEKITPYLEMRTNKKSSDPLFISHSPHNYMGRLTTRTISRTISNHLNLIGIKNKRLTCHSLRHTFTTLAMENGSHFIYMQQTLRLINANYVNVYNHAPEKDLRRAELFLDL